MQGMEQSLGPAELYNQHTRRHLSGWAPLPRALALGAQLTDRRH